MSEVLIQNKLFSLIPQTVLVSFNKNSFDTINEKLFNYCFIADDISDSKIRNSLFIILLFEKIFFMHPPILKHLK